MCGDLSMFTPLYTVSYMWELEIGEPWEGTGRLYKWNNVPRFGGFHSVKCGFTLYQGIRIIKKCEK